MVSSRFNLKVFLAEWNVTPEETFKTFNDWITETDGETLIDVADYSHVHEGPVTLLVGHDANYSIDTSNSELGLVYSRKQPLNGDPGSWLGSVFKSALSACLRLERDEKLQGRVKFRGDRFLLINNDRLHTPNSATSLEVLRSNLESFLNNLFDGSPTRVEHNTDKRKRLCITVSTSKQFDIAALVARLDA